MRIVVNLTEDSDDVLAEFSAGAKLYLLSSTTEDGSYTDVTSAAIVSGTEQYELTDAAGTSSTWYKTQVGNDSGSLRGSLSEAFRATAWDAYATVDDLLRTVDVPQGSGSSERHNVLADLLRAGREQTDADCGRTFLRVPQVSGTVTVHFDIANGGCRSLVSAIGHPYTTDGRALDIVSVTSLWYRDNEEADYVSLGTQDTDWFLEAGHGPGIAGTDWPYEDITLSARNTARSTWPTGKRAGRMVAVLGFPRIPLAVTRANVDRARDAYRVASGSGPATAGVNQFGVPVFQTGMSESYRRLIAPGSVYLKRSWRV